ncbi:arsenosugar biosynthesis radical SAM (seleno)protein ArsS [Fodinibius sediminis]|uniref:arsenosugar biosynthesis radical SAM (seleno)protein ArsS n=1 Tax=Fodinibius sediminis TaxID=1214077 RepID=UPI001157BC9F
MKSLKTREHKLSDPNYQLQLLNSHSKSLREQPKFRDKLGEAGLFPLEPTGIEIFQMNLGYMCNMTCKHCHVDAGPDRSEMMDRETFEHCIEALRHSQATTVDLTGGAPEMNPHFKWFVEEASRLGKNIIVRSNLTILTTAPKYRALVNFFADHQVEVTCSLPFYNRSRTDRQRGEGTYDKSIEALQKLNHVGYGKEETGLELNLVYNPAGAFLPGGQASMEQTFKEQLHRQHGIVFNNLYTITNLPISRFLDFLLQSGNLDEYMDRLISSFNPAAARGVMCRNTISVGWDGQLYDCDFNQMLEMPVEESAPGHISEWHEGRLNNRTIRINQHCFGCTAGAGSSCGGATT